MFNHLPCESHIAHIAHVARTRGSVRVRRLGACRAWHRSLPGAPPARHRRPAEVGIPTLLFHRGRNSDFALASDFARKILRKRCDGERIASGVGFHPEKPITGPAPEVRQRGCPRHTAVGVFFTTRTPCRQSWREHRIALIPGALKQLESLNNT